MEQELEKTIQKKDGNMAVHITDPKTNFKTSYTMSFRLKRNLDEKIIPDLKKRDFDHVLVIDGREGSGKSTLAFQIGKYVDPTLTVDRVVFAPDDFREAVLTSKKGQCIIYDEAFTGFSSRASLSPINKVLVSLAMQMRQKNLFIIIVLPTIFLLDKYVAILRSTALIHVYRSKSGARGFARVYNDSKKRKLILQGSKTWNYHIKGLYTRFKIRFFGKFALGDEKEEKKYLDKKLKALSDSEKTSMTSAQVKFREQRDLLIYLLRKTNDFKLKEVENLLGDYDLMLSYQQIGKICAKYGDIGEDKPENEKKESKKDEISQNDASKEDLSPKIDEKDIKNGNNTQ